MIISFLLILLFLFIWMLIWISLLIPSSRPASSFTRSMHFLWMRIIVGIKRSSRTHADWSSLSWWWKLLVFLTNDADRPPIIIITSWEVRVGCLTAVVAVLLTPFSLMLQKACCFLLIKTGSSSLQTNNFWQQVWTNITNDSTPQISAFKGEMTNDFLREIVLLFKDECFTRQELENETRKQVKWN